MYKTLIKARTTDENKVQVNEGGNRLAGLIEMLKSNPTSDTKKIKNRNHMLEVVKSIL